MVMHTFLTLALLAAASATVASAQKLTDRRVHRNIKGVPCAMDMNEARKKSASRPTRATPGFFIFPRRSLVRALYDKGHKVFAVAVHLPWQRPRRALAEGRARHGDRGKGRRVDVQTDPLTRSRVLGVLQQDAR